MRLAMSTTVRDLDVEATRVHVRLVTCVPRSQSGTIRSIKSEPALWKLRADSTVNYG